MNSGVAMELFFPGSLFFIWSDIKIQKGLAIILLCYLGEL